MSSYLVQHFLKISKNLEQGNCYGGSLGKFCPICLANDFFFGLGTYVVVDFCGSIKQLTCTGTFHDTKFHV